MSGAFGMEDGDDLLRLGICEMRSGGGNMKNHDDWLPAANSARP